MNATATLVHPNGKELAVLGDNFGRGGEAIYHAIGFKANERVQREVIDSGAQYQAISLELLQEYADADIVFLCSWDQTTEEELKAVVDSGVWRQLPAVRENRVIVLDYKTFFYFDPISVLGQIEALADVIERTTGRNRSSEVRGFWHDGGAGQS
ncbi:ABC transporter substrate-binding protein [Brevibacillus agri]|uniref:ABC transporter substrate-binding protein n=1 Tax=Brevibacillus agri TaxID=51101 RepID=UPI001F50DD14|nr:ABC transporter substrate-binding protein [Brevibacillus agri]